ncbi:bifunctional proline dehydrogenase/L-glutamate gamma-semialdehyde dehydrogenase PutA [Aliishimia ponticola]|uniref:Bifunctional protein PutA n=1 Tax=Aliishimia ponticola TaxID=2499833 RepID=A0A4S4ND19_9RHOB|nr:bifunctional proline dehydrogenase/L-glutamate gamma-semialdehyde dehydrogenase PutA [Aliishimia ponticola]THH37366.1 bifunctional proline dehydrogenase/L-glutamate gamma-semialdehyde dehydrogenase PutA [Aliishimia ponticola]
MLNAAFDRLPEKLDDATYADPTQVLTGLTELAALTPQDRATITAQAAALVRQIRSAADPGLMEVFLAEYGLSTDEGVALMCLAEALLRVPDADTMDALIEDKIAPSDWGRHLGHSASTLVNASTWALMLTGRVLDDDAPGLAGTLRGAIKRVGEPVIRTAVARAMKEMGRQFVLGEDIAAAMKRAKGMEALGFTYSYDMLGEAAMTEAAARKYHLSYSRAISAIAGACTSQDIRENPGISVKLSALHPRYEVAQTDRVLAELVPRLRALAQLAASAGMGLNIDAEEADRLTLSMAVIEEVLADPGLKGWDGFGVVVQAYGQRTGAVLDHLHAMATRLDRKLMVRLVKGAYWDSEVKQAQTAGVEGFPVFTRKPASDVSYIANARKLLGMTDRIYPQFATHNAHTVAAILHMADGAKNYEFQRLHGMGEALHKLVMAQHGTRCRIYAPVGAHRDLLAYLVRRLLENGANSSFVNQIVDEDVAPEQVAADPFDALAANPPALPDGPELFAPERRNSKGFDIAHMATLRQLDRNREEFATSTWTAGPMLAKEPQGGAADTAEDVINPARPGDVVGQVQWSTPKDVETALIAAEVWKAPAGDRARILRRAADLYEAHHAELFALLSREAGKTLADAVAELREAVDFLRYYAANAPDHAPVGTFACISPWNFPLAIFTGQLSAALAAGNAVLAKPAEQTPLIAARAIALLHEAGVPRSALQLLPGAGDVGAALTSDPRVGGVAFTGGTDTARLIRKSMAENLTPGAPLIAETGGLNAMIVDSTALPEQAVGAVIESAFQSAGQRCSALRCLYVQEDIAEDFRTLLIGAMDQLRQGDPWQIGTDVGPVIDAEAQQAIAVYIDTARRGGRILHEGKTPDAGHFIAPTLLSVRSIAEMEREIFGPVLHLATFRADELDQVITDINATGFGLTFGLQTRIDDRVQHVSDRIHAGNIYVNRNQIGAIVGSQPFGGEGLSGTGPKAGGPLYLSRFTRGSVPRQAAAQTLPGPTGELNAYSLHQRDPILCLGPGAAQAETQAKSVRALGGVATAAPDATPQQAADTKLLGGVLWWGDAETGRAIDTALAAREGPLVPLITGEPDQAHVMAEKHLCVDTTAAGGNAALLGAMSEG